MKCLVTLDSRDMPTIDMVAKGMDISRSDLISQLVVTGIHSMLGRFDSDKETDAKAVLAQLRVVLESQAASARADLIMATTKQLSERLNAELQRSQVADARKRAAVNGKGRKNGKR